MRNLKRCGPVCDFRGFFSFSWWWIGCYCYLHFDYDGPCKVFLLSLSVKSLSLTSIRPICLLRSPVSRIYSSTTTNSPVKYDTGSNQESSSEKIIIQSVQLQKKGTQIRSVLIILDLLLGTVRGKSSFQFFRMNASLN